MIHKAALTNDGCLYSWGKNRSCCLGLGSKDDQPFPLKVYKGLRRSQLYVANDNFDHASHFILDHPTCQPSLLNLTHTIQCQVALGGKVVSVSLGVDHSMAVVKSWMSK